MHRDPFAKYSLQLQKSHIPVSAPGVFLPFKSSSRIQMLRVTLVQAQCDTKVTEKQHMKLKTLHWPTCHERDSSAYSSKYTGSFKAVWIVKMCFAFRNCRPTFELNESEKEASIRSLTLRDFGLLCCSGQENSLVPIWKFTTDKIWYCNIFK